MGYCMEQTGGVFGIDKANEAAALQAIKDLAGKGTISDSSGRHFSWVDDREYANASTLAEALTAWRWDATECPMGSGIADITFTGEKWGDDNIVFDAIAPFVRAGSYIEMLGEDGERWRWVFDGSDWRQVNAKTVWED